MVSCDTCLVVVICIFFYSIYRGTGYFVFGRKRQSFKLQHCQITFSIKCYLSVHQLSKTDDQQMMLSQRQGLLTHLKESISKVHHTYMPSAKAPIEYVECPLVHESNYLPHIRLDGINVTDDVFCSVAPICIFSPLPIPIICLFL